MFTALLRYWYVGLVPVVITGYWIISPIPVLLGMPSRDISLTYRALALGFCLFVMSFHILNRRITFGAFSFAYIAFWMMYSARIIYETDAHPEILSREVHEYYLFAFLGTLLPSLACFVRFGEAEALTMGKMLWIMSAIAAIGAMVSYILVPPADNVSRFALETLNPISVGQLGMTLLTVALALYRFLDSRLRWFAVGSVVLGFTLLTVAASRGAIVAAAITIGTIYLIHFYRALSKGAIGSVIVLLVLGGVITAFPLSIFEYVQTEYGFNVLYGLQTMGTEVDQSAQMRQVSFRGAWNQFLDSPLIGDALEERITRFYPHNNILEAFLATGIFGGLILLGLYIVSFFNAVKLIASQSAYSWIGVALLGYLIISQSAGAIWSSDALFCLMALASVSIGVVSASSTGAARGGEFQRPQHRPGGRPLPGRPRTHQWR